MAERQTQHSVLSPQSSTGGRRLRITQIKSGIGYHYSQKETLRTLGFRRLNQTVEQPDTPTVRGMVRKVSHLVRVEEVAEPETPTASVSVPVEEPTTSAEAAGPRRRARQPEAAAAERAPDGTGDKQ